jgi:exopolysaccharide biosynthesis polyprenyl glycosylphosphotransferase
VNVIHRRILLLLLKFFDLFVTTASYGLATYLLVSVDHGRSFSGFLSIRIKLSNFVIFAVALLAWHLIYSMCHLYESKRLSTAKETILEEMKATGLVAACLLVLAVSFRIKMITPPFLVLFWSINSLGMLASRLLLRHSLGGIRKHGRNLRHIVILGTNARAREFARRIHTKPEWGYRNLGFIDENWFGLEEFGRSGQCLIGGFNDLAEFLRKNIVDEVAIYLPLRSFHEQASRAAALCGEHGITVRYDSNIFGLKTTQSESDGFDADPYFLPHRGTREGWPLIFKRLLDLAVSSILLVILLPLFAVVAALIKLTSPGSVLFLQERVGLNKRRFRICKFRTMVTNAEGLMPELEKLNEISGPVFKIKRDPRITPIGKWLRRTSIDELPQLLNVLKGDMSLVGPRPLPVRDFEGFSEDWQRRRFSVRPGITCLWQVQGRSSIGFERWMELDIQYLDEWSLWLDLKILAMTIPAVMKGSGAV